MNFIENLYQLHQETYNKLQDDESVILMGPTGCGKTTIGLFLSGCQLEKKTINKQFRIDIKDEQLKKEMPLIGHNEHSQTKLPQFFKGNMSIIDLPGYNDNLGLEMQINVQFLNYTIFKFKKSVRIILVLSWSSLMERGQLDFKFLVNTLYRNLGLQMADIISKIGIIINRYDDDSLAEDIIDMAQYLSDRFQTYFDQNEAQVQVVQQDGEELDYNQSYAIFLSILKNATYFKIHVANKKTQPFVQETYDDAWQWINGQLKQSNFQNTSPYLPLEAQLLFDEKYQQYIDQQMRLLEQQVIAKTQRYEQTFSTCSIDKFTNQYLEEVLEFHQKIRNNQIFQNEKSVITKTLSVLNIQKYQQLNQFSDQCLEDVRIRIYQMKVQCQQYLKQEEMIWKKDVASMKRRVRQVENDFNNALFEYTTQFRNMNFKAVNLVYFLFNKNDKDFKTRINHQVKQLKQLTREHSFKLIYFKMVYSKMLKKLRNQEAIFKEQINIAMKILKHSFEQLSQNNMQIWAFQYNELFNKYQLKIKLYCMNNEQLYQYGTDVQEYTVTLINILSWMDNKNILGNIEKFLKSDQNRIIFQVKLQQLQDIFTQFQRQQEIIELMHENGKKTMNYSVNTEGQD